MTESIADQRVIPTLDPASPLPLYSQISRHFESLIEQGVLQPGEQLPSERALCDETGVSRMTVRQAMHAMVLDGYCERAKGKGIFVRARHVIVDSQRFEGFTVNVSRQGLVAKTRSLGSRIVAAPPKVREALGLDDDARAVELKRLRLVSGRPAVLETEWFPADRFGALLHEDMSKSLYAALDRLFQVRIASTVDVILPYLPDAQEREILGLAEGVPVILRERVGSTEDNVAVEVVRSVYHPEQYEFRMSLVPAEAGES